MNKSGLRYIFWEGLPFIGVIVAQLIILAPRTREVWLNGWFLDPDEHLSATVCFLILLGILGISSLLFYAARRWWFVENKVDQAFLRALFTTLAILVTILGVLFSYLAPSLLDLNQDSLWQECQGKKT